MTTEEFINKAISKHGGFYEYKKTNYINSTTKVIITCPKHGDFLQTPNNHLTGYGCNICGREACSMSQRDTTTVFINKAEHIHGKRYDYNFVRYVNSKTPVTIICKIHGEFTMAPSNHIHKTKPQGCPSCGRLQRGTDRKLSQKDIIERFKIVHGDLYDYSECVYSHYHSKVDIICKDHGKFQQTPAHHINGTGCPACNLTGFNYNKPAILYYLSVNDGEAYKIGITNRTVDLRFSPEDLKNIKILNIWKFNTGKKAYIMEQQVIKVFKKDKYIGIPLLASGNSELFKKNIFPAEMSLEELQQFLIKETDKSKG